MPRPPRHDIIIPGGTYHVYARGNDRMTLFREPEDYGFYLAALADLMTPHGVVLFHYVLMPNHVHLLLRPDGPTPFSGFMQTLQTRYVKRFCKKYRSVGHVWQGRFKNRTIDNNAYLFACGNYIELNPVRAGFVADPADWPYSSYHAYAHGKPDGLVTLDPLYASLGRTDSERQVAYRRLISQTRRTSDPVVPGTKVSGTCRPTD